MKRFGMANAKDLFKRAFGSCKDIAYLYGRKPDEYGSGYEMALGELQIRAVHEANDTTVAVTVTAMCLTNSFTMVFDAQTYERNFQIEDAVLLEHRKDLLRDWVTANGSEHCCKMINRFWEECS